MNRPRRLQRMLQKMSPKQQALNFGIACPWAQLPAADRQACRDAIAALLFQVATATSLPDGHQLEESDEHER